MKIVNLVLHGAYTEGYAYQENCLPYYQKKVFHADVTVICGQWALKKGTNDVQIVDASTYVDKNGIKIIRKKSTNNRVGQKLAIIHGVYDTLEKEKPDYIFVHLIQSLSLGVIRKYKRKHPNVMIYADSHSDYINSAKNFFSRLFLHKILWRTIIRRNLPYIEKIYGVLPARVDFLKEMYKIPKEKVDLLIMGAEDDLLSYDSHLLFRKMIRDKYLIKDEDLVFITGGKIDKKKNIHNLISVFERINNPYVKLVVFGSIDNEMRALYSSFENSRNIIYVGWQNSEEIYKLFHCADLSIFPGTHSVLWEQSIGAGLPGIFKRWKGIEHIDQNGNVFFLETETVEELEASILKFVNNKDYLNIMSERAKQVRKLFLYSNIAKKSLGK